MDANYNLVEVHRIVQNLMVNMDAPEAAERISPLIEAMLEVHRQKSLVSGGDGTVSIRSIHVSRFDVDDRSQPTLTTTAGDQSMRIVGELGMDGGCAWYEPLGGPTFIVCLFGGTI